MRLLLATDLHYSADLAAEVAANLGAAGARLPADTYDHMADGKLYWHNLMLVEEGERLCDGLARLVDQEQPDLLILLGDLVNVNWTRNVAAAARRIAALPCPVRLVTGNHDIYLDEDGCRVQDALAPGDFATGLRHEIADGLGILYLDLFAQDAAGLYHKRIDPAATERMDYRPEDIAAALRLLDAHPQTPWLAFGHVPMTAPDPALRAPGRKIGGAAAHAAPLAARLHAPGNLLGVICGHQHFAHFQRFAHGFHWTLPSLVEYPCAAAIVEWTGREVQARTVAVDAALAARSLQPRQAAWTAGDAPDRAFTWRRP
jgi:hypothetical protein